MKHKVLMLPEAEGDLVAIYRYVAEHDSAGKAEKLLTVLEQKCSVLNGNPERGHGVPELRRIYVTGFREIHYKPYRIIYQIVGDKVYIHAVLDGRRELHELLEKRLMLFNE